MIDNSPNETLENTVHKLFLQGINVNKYLRDNHPELGEDEIIRLSYEAQAGSYVSEMNTCKNEYSLYRESIAKHLNLYITDSSSILDAGCGELTSSIELISSLSKQKYIGLDGSFSRLIVGRSVINSAIDHNINNVQLVASSLLNIPLESSSIDVVFTSHALEPNFINSKIIIAELSRVTKKYLVLFEPCYETASQEMKDHMNKHNYVRNIEKDCLSSGLILINKIEIHESIEPLRNKTTMFLFEKILTLQSSTSSINYVTPNNIKSSLIELSDGSLVSKHENIIYPSVLGIKVIQDGAGIQISDTSKFV